MSGYRTQIEVFGEDTRTALEESVNKFLIGLGKEALSVQFSMVERSTAVLYCAMVTYIIKAD